MFKAFKEFAFRGNVIDLAVGVILGAAFSGIIKSLVDSIFMPLIGIIIGGIDVKGLSVEVGNANLLYGQFLQASIEFILIAFALFLFVKGIIVFAGKRRRQKKSQLRRRKKNCSRKSVMHWSVNRMNE